MMKSLFLVFLAIAVVAAKSLEQNVNVDDIIAAEIAAQEQQLCEPGKLDRCTGCVCIADGTSYTCERIQSNNVREWGGVLQIPTKDGNDVANPETFYQPCRCRCKCSNNCSCNGGTCNCNSACQCTCDCN